MNPVSSARFTLDGSAALESHLAQVCDEVRDGVAALIPASRLDGLLLGGGYGRGEGGVWRGPEGDRPYNDLEFYVFVRGSAVLGERQWREPLHHLGERLSPGAGLEVEFKVLTLSKLRGSAPTMFYYDLVMGHRHIAGSETLLAGCEHHRAAKRIPLAEATRLLMNRCSGLLFSAERLRRPGFGAEEADFVGRNLAKAQLALGDVWLTLNGLYHWSCRERHERLLRSDLDGLSWAERLRAHHAAGVAFKLHPVRSTETREELAARHAELSELGRQLWLWLEARRLQRDFASARDYGLSSADKCPETSPWRNRLVTWRAFGAAEALGGRGARYPRARLLHALSLLLWEPDPLHDLEIRGRLASELRADATDFAGWVAAYARLWSRFN